MTSETADGPTPALGVRWHRSGAVGTLLLDRPDRLNALDTAAVRELVRLVRTEAVEPGVRVVVVRGAGRAFCSGADLGATAEAADDGGETGEGGLAGILDAVGELVLGLRALPVPVVAVLRGPAAGVGASLALACDLVLAARSAYLLLAFSRVGLTLDGGASLLVASAAGRARAMEMALLADRVPAEQALNWGLVNAVHDDDALDAAVDALTDRLVAGPPRAYAATKAAVGAAVDGLLAGQLALESRLQQEVARTADAAEGMAAFLERRPPRFTGR